VGIGTSSPTSQLTVGSGGSANPASTVAFHNSAADEYRLKLTSASFNADGKWLGLGFGYSDNYMKAAIIAEAKDSNARTNLHFCLDGNANNNNAALADSKMTITYGGNVGIGTTSPANALTVNSGTTNTVAQFISTDSGAGIKLTDNVGSSSVQTTDEVLRIGVDEDAAVASSAIAFRVDGSEKVRIDSSGNVGIGTTSPGDSLHLKNNSSFQLRFDSSGANKWRLGAGWSGFYEESFIISDTNAGNRLVIDPNGKVGIGTSSPTSALDVVGDIEVSGGVYLGGTAAANKLDDYEEGTWTPALGGTWSVNPTALSGTYTKIGRLVSISLYFSGGTKASAIAGYFTGLPFAQSSSGTGAVTDAGVNDKGIALVQNVDRVWLTETAFNTSTYVVATYTTT
jgi:hypothetical protein